MSSRLKQMPSLGAMFVENEIVRGSGVAEQSGDASLGEKDTVRFWGWLEAQGEYYAVRFAFELPYEEN